jgi:hypothetical protein
MPQNYTSGTCVGFCTEYIYWIQTAVSWWLEQKRTTVVYGHNHFCKKHNEIVDSKHIDECDMLAVEGTTPTEIVKPLQNVESIWDLKEADLGKLMREIL